LLAFEIAELVLGVAAAALQQEPVIAAVQIDAPQLVRPLPNIDFIVVSARMSRLCRLRYPYGRLDLRHRVAIGLEVLKQMAVTVERHIDRGVAHHRLQALR